MDQEQRHAIELRHARQDEQRRIAGVLHEGVAQTLAGLRLQLGVLGNQLKEDPQAQQGLSELHPLVEQSLTELQSLIASLRPAVPEDVGLPAALRALVSFVSTSTGKDIRFHIDEPFPTLLLPIESILYQAIKEMLSLTSEQRSALTPADIRLEMHTSALRLSMQFSTAWSAAAHQSTASLLSHIREQVEAVGGTCLMLSREERTASVVLTVPPLLRNAE